MKNIVESKRNLRSKVANKRKNLTIQQVSENSQLICKLIIKEKLIEQNNNFVLYYPFQNEVNLLSLAEHLLSAGKDIYFPRYNKKKESYDLAKIESLSNDFVKGKFGIMEPTEQAKGFEKDSFVATWFIPGVAFDKVGNRLGRGGGYYDRFLSYNDGTFIAVAHSVQLVDAIPSEAHDMKMNWLVTEEMTYNLTVD